MGGVVVTVDTRHTKTRDIQFEEITDISGDLHEAEYIDDDAAAPAAGSPHDHDAMKDHGAGSWEGVLEEQTRITEGRAEPRVIDDAYQPNSFDIEALSADVDRRPRRREQKEPVEASVDYTTLSSDIDMDLVVDGEANDDTPRIAPERIVADDAAFSAPVRDVGPATPPVTEDEFARLEIDMNEIETVLSESDLSTADSIALEHAADARTPGADRGGEAVTRAGGDLELIDAPSEDAEPSIDQARIEHFSDAELESFLDDAPPSGGRIGDELEFDFPDDDVLARSGADRRIGDKDRREVDDGFIDTGGQSGKKNRITIELDDGVADRLPDDFDITELGAIDLREAEAVANEDVVFLTEEDLIEELQDVDLVFLAENGAVEDSQEDDALRAHSARDRRRKDERPDELIEVIDDDAHGDVASEVDGGEGAVEELMLDAEGREMEPAAPRTDSRVARGSKRREDDRGSTHADDAVFSGTDGALAELETYDGNDFDVVFDTLDKSRQPDSGTGALLQSRDSKPAVTPRAAVRRERESLPHDIIAIAEKFPGTQVIDDGLVERGDEAAPAEIFRQDELDRITADIIETVESDARLLEEANVADDQGKIASVMKGSAPAFEDLLIDFEDEYQFVDNELKFIDAAILDDVQKNGFDGTDNAPARRAKKTTQAVEIVGLTADEIGVIEKSVFAGEDDAVVLPAAPKAGMAGGDRVAARSESADEMQYRLPSPESLNADERASIEEDLASGAAYVFEENVADIRRKLDHLVREKEAGAAGAPDIGADVVFIDNKSDVDRFVETLPAAKREDMRKLLAYLDGLFEKLPEEVVQRFAESEYFSLYQDVLKEMGL